jgi:hypothetical protein
MSDQVGNIKNGYPRVYLHNFQYLENKSNVTLAFIDLYHHDSECSATIVLQHGRFKVWKICSRVTPKGHP